MTLLYMIVSIEKSPLKNKRFRVHLNNGDKYDFGLKDGQTYIDHKNKKLRENYLKRHYVNEKKLIDNLIPSPALFSAYLLWTGPNLEDNIKQLNKLWAIKHNK